MSEKVVLGRTTLQFQTESRLKRGEIEGQVSAIKTRLINRRCSLARVAHLSAVVRHDSAADSRCRL